MTLSSEAAMLFWHRINISRRVAGTFSAAMPCCVYMELVPSVTHSKHLSTVQYNEVQCSKEDVDLLHPSSSRLLVGPYTHNDIIMIDHAVCTFCCASTYCQSISITNYRLHGCQLSKMENRDKLRHPRLHKQFILKPSQR